MVSYQQPGVDYGNSGAISPPFVPKAFESIFLLNRAVSFKTQGIA